MFLLKSIGSIVFGNCFVNPPGSKVTKALVFKNASATIKRTTVPHNFQLLITRIFEEGEDEDDEDAETEFSFLIDEVLRFRRVVNGSKRGFFWVDPLDDNSTTAFEFIVNSANTNDTSFSTFEHLVYQSMFERRSSKDHSEASEEELNAYIHFAKAAANSFKLGGTPASKSKTVEPMSSPLGRTPEKAPANVPSVESTPNKAEFMSTSNTPAGKVDSAPGGMASFPPQTAPQGESLVEATGELYLFDNRYAQFMKMRDTVTASIVRTAPYEFYLLVSERDEIYISQPLETQMNAQFNAESKAFVWLYRESDDTCYPWSLKFFEKSSEARFREAFGACMYEANNGEKFGKTKEDERSYLINAYQEDVEMADAQEEQGAEDDESEEEEDVPESERVIPEDRSFFVRGKSIGVVKHNSDDTIEYATAIENVSTLDKDFFSPKNLMLQDQDTSLLMMKPDDEHKIYRMDLNVGKVVEEWKVDDYMAVDSIVPDFKSAAMTPQRTLVGINQNSIFRIDPRLAGNKLVESESKQYVTKNKFSCAITTGKGELAVASAKGDIRLYNKLNVRAKTHLPGLGDPIIGIDTTENGKYIVATCKNYLLLIATEAKDAKDQAISGFSKLQLRPEHVAFMGCPVSFTPARFNCGDEEERSIVTSTGPYVITWNFRRVKQGKLDDYTIKKYNETVVADNFKYGQDKAIIVALPGDVQSVTKSKLQTPAKMLKSRSSIVNSPY
ncbi:VID27 cytoplasmic protein-domain-containing protein [Chytridium lagenaria]|nr:VID27 cytoplasmic protein-domain-containing protein [Chytridium lagenaria]